MEPITGLFIFGLYKATEKIWDKAFDAAWEPVDEALKKRFARWAGTDKESQRQAAFEKAAEIACANTLRIAADPPQVQQILDALNSGRDRRNAEAMAEEAAKLMLFSAAPDVPRLTEICQRTLRFEALFAEEVEAPPPPETVAAVLSDFLTNLREALLDQEPYHDLIQREMLRAMREVVTELRPVDYDDEAAYRHQMAQMYRPLDFVGIPELKDHRPITVEDIFIHLRAEREAEPEAERELLEAYRRAEEMGDEEALARLREARNRLVHAPTPKARIDIEEALRGTKQLVVLGDPGAGKTTLLKYLTVICAEGRAEAELGLKTDGAGLLLPVFIPLREFAAECAGRDQDYCLLDYLYTQTREHLLLNLPRGLFEEALEAGRCLVCLDGLDEVWAVGQRKAITDAVKALAARFPRSRYAVTSRLVGYEEAPLDRRDFIHHTILPLEDDDVREFIRKWYQVRERDPVQRKRRADDLIATVEREPRIQSLARNPLLLTIIVLVHRIEAELPHERVKLYDKCVTALVDTWEEVKGLTMAEKQRSFYRYRRRLLERLAFELHTRVEEPGKVATVKEGDLERLLTNFLMKNRRLGFTDDPDGAREEARAFIRLARGRTGLLIERGDKVFAFPHLTFQEYLSACEIEQRCFGRGADAVWEVIQNRLHDSHWQEVILLLLGSLNKYEYDDPTTELVERILKAGEQDKFELVLHRNLYLAARALADRVDVADDLHRRAVGTMLELAREAPEWEQVDAFVALSWLEQDDYAVNGLLALARDAQVVAGVRSTAAQALGQLGRAEEAAEILLALARDAQVADLVRSAAAQALGQLGRAEEAAELLLALARDAQVAAGVRRDTAQALGQLGRAEEAAEILLALARDKKVDDLVRCDTAQVLGQLGRAEEKVLDGLLALAHDEQVANLVRRAAAQALGQLGRTEEKVLDSLLALARDEKMDDWGRCAAAQALGQLGRAEEAAEILLALARDEKVDDWVRCAAAQALGQLGRAEEAAKILLTLARDEQIYDWVRSDAAQALGQLGRAEEAAEILLALARDEQVNDWVRGDTAQALGQLGRAEEAAELLLALARDEKVDDWVRSDAAQALGGLGRAEDEVLDGLLALARDEKVANSVRGVIQALGQLGRAEEVTELLLALARDEQVAVGVRRAAAQALGQLGRAEEAAETLLALARDEQVAVGVRRAAAQALGQLGHAEEKVLDGLLALARDEQVAAGVRSAAAQALGQLGHAEDEVLNGLLALARDEQVDDRARSAAAQALGQLGRAEEAAELLLALARDEQVDGWVRSAAAQALGQLGRAEEAAEILLALARDEQVTDWVRSDAAQTLDQPGRAEETAEILLALARDEQVTDWVRSDAAQALGQLGRVEEQVLDGLLALARDEQVAAGVRSAAAQALGQLGRAEEQVLDGLLALARDEQAADWVRRAAAQALGQLGRAEEAAELLLALAHDEQVDNWVRRAAAQALGQLGRAEEAAEVLLVLARDKYDRVRSDAAQALGQIGRAEDKVLDSLLALARDEQVADSVRSAAHESLKKLVEGATE